MEGSLLPSSITLSVGEAGGNNEISPAAAAFECNICSEPPSDPVATSCGHVFCWHCIHHWIQSRPKKPCPVCRTLLKNRFLNILPLGQATHAQQSSSSIPKRPPKPALFIPIMKRARDECTEDCKVVRETMRYSLEQVSRKRARMSIVVKKLNELRESNSRLMDERKIDMNSDLQKAGVNTASVHHVFTSMAT